MSQINATYVSVWDDGIEVSSDCQYNSETKTVSEITSVVVDGLDILIREYVELPDGRKITSFYNEDNDVYVNGTCPNCNSNNINLFYDADTSLNGESEWGCNDCYTTFDKPII